MIKINEGIHDRQTVFIHQLEDAGERFFATFDIQLQAAIRRMMPRGAGRIVNIGSIAGLIVRTKQIAYCAAKAAAIHFTRCLAVEMAPHVITVHCLCPGMTHSEMIVQSFAERGIDLDAAASLIPTGRLATGADHAHLVAYFASEEAAHVTGQVVAVDGGQSQFLPLPRRS